MFNDYFFIYEKIGGQIYFWIEDVLVSREQFFDFFLQNSQEVAWKINLSVGNLPKTIFNKRENIVNWENFWF